MHQKCNPTLKLQQGILPKYNSWNNILQRCENKNNKAYKNYGGRGIKVCKRWHKFKNFLADMGLKPSPEHTLERIDNNGNYEPKNCKWATQKEQNRNMRRTIKINGLYLKDFANKNNLKYTTAWCRYHRAGDRGKRLSRPMSFSRLHIE